MDPVSFEQNKSLLSRKKKIFRSLMNSVGKENLTLHFQPLYSIKDRKTYGFEALLRLDDPELGEVIPGEFIPVAEQTGLIKDIGKWCMEQACIFSNTLSLLGHKDMIVSLNVSAIQIMSDTFVDDVMKTIRMMRTDPHMLIFELTESVLLRDINDHQHKLEELRDMGIRIAIDDFGVGYSSFCYLLDLPVDIVKIDRNFINHLLSKLKNNIAVESIINMAKKMGIYVIAEGVETKRQFEEIMKFECDSFQGFYLSPAIPWSEVSSFLANKVVL